jgi:hypothetical protein
VFQVGGNSVSTSFFQVTPGWQEPSPRLPAAICNHVFAWGYQHALHCVRDGLFPTCTSTFVATVGPLFCPTRKSGGRPAAIRLRFR